MKKSAVLCGLYAGSILTLIVLEGCASKKQPVSSSYGSSYGDPYYTAPSPRPVYTPPPQPVLPEPVAQPEPVIRQPETTTIVPGRDFVVSDLSAKMGDIDDIGLLFVRHSDGSVVLAQSSAWKYGLDGSATGPLNQYLGTGTNLIIFTLYNHKGKQLPFGQSLMNKWSYSFSLFGDGTAIWNNSEQGKQLENGIMSWKVFSAVSNSSGQFVVSRASENQLSMLKPAFNRLNTDFQKHPASDNISDISAAIAVGIRTGVSGSD